MTTAVTSGYVFSLTGLAPDNFRGARYNGWKVRRVQYLWQNKTLALYPPRVFRQLLATAGEPAQLLTVLSVGPGQGCLSTKNAGAAQWGCVPWARSFSDGVRAVSGRGP